MTRTILLALFAILLTPATVFAGGWTQPEGAGYAKVWGSYLGGSAAYGLDGEAVQLPDFRLVRLHAYSEYGLSDDFTLVGSLQPLGSATLDGDSVTFAGAAMIGARQRFISDGIQFAVEARAGGQPGSTDLAPAEAEYSFQPAVRSGRFEWEAQVGYALPFGWITASAGPRWYSSATLSDELFANAQIGFGPFAGFLFDVHFTANTTLSPLESARPNLTGAGNTRYVGAGIGISYWPTAEVGFHLGADGALTAQSNLAVPPLQLGVEFRY